MTILVAFILVPIISLILVIINYVLAPHRPMTSKGGVVECGMMTLTNQSRRPYSIVFIVVALLFVILDLEVVLLWPATVAMSIIGPYGFYVIILFVVVLTLGFVVELASGALSFSSRGSSDPLYCLL